MSGALGWGGSVGGSGGMAGGREGRAGRGFGKCEGAGTVTGEEGGQAGVLVRCKRGTVVQHSAAESRQLTRIT